MQRRPTAAILTGCMILAGASRADAGPPPPTGAATDQVDQHLAASMRGDAELAAICFVGLQHGWAGGDRGTIWHPRDGGPMIPDTPS